jgi:hypothetical protein
MIGTDGRCGWGGISEEDDTTTDDDVLESCESSSLRCCAEETIVVLDHLKNITVRYPVSNDVFP